MIAYRARSRTKLLLLFFVIAFVLVATGVYLHFFRHKEPTHGIFVYHCKCPTGRATGDGYLYKTT